MNNQCTTEKTIISSKPARALIPVLITIGVGFLLVFSVMYIGNVGECRYFPNSYGHLVGPSIFDVMIFEANGNDLVSLCLDLGLLFSIIGVLLCIACVNNMVTVTNKRVYGTALWGNKVDLAFDTISSVSATGLNGISVTTSSRTISFKMIKNNEDIYEAISDLLIERQGKQTGAATIIQETPQSSADELKKFKELYDAGVITEEEFNAKKKQLLGL